MGGNILLVCCGIVLSIPLGFLLLVYIFRQACAYCGLPRPGYLTAAFIILVNFAVDAVALWLLEALVWQGAQQVGVPRWESWIVTRFLDLPVDLAISAGLHAVLMSIKFGKGIEVWFVQRLIQLSIVAAVTFVGGVVYLIQAN